MLNIQFNRREGAKDKQLVFSFYPAPHSAVAIDPFNHSHNNEKHPPNPDQMHVQSSKY